MMIMMMMMIRRRRMKMTVTMMVMGITTSLQHHQLTLIQYLIQSTTKERNE